jgi:hypothetical protein
LRQGENHNGKNRSACIFPLDTPGQWPYNQRIGRGNQARPAEIKTMADYTLTLSDALRRHMSDALNRVMAAQATEIAQLERYSDADPADAFAVAFTPSADDRAADIAAAYSLGMEAATARGALWGETAEHTAAVWAAAVERARADAAH